MFEEITEIVNLTPHEINIWHGKVVKDIPPSGNVARLHITSRKVGELMGIPVYRSSGRRVLNLPAPKKGVIYLVSSVIAKEVRRPDVLCPDTTDEGVLRDGAGNIKGVTRLQCYAEVS